MTYLNKVQFVSNVAFGGQVSSLNRSSAGDRVGASPPEITLDEKMRFVSLVRVVAGKEEEVIVPMSNVASFVVCSDAEVAAIEKKKAEREPAKKPEEKKK
jgi:hypothetical protein